MLQRLDSSAHHVRQIVPSIVIRNHILKVQIVIPMERDHDGLFRRGSVRTDCISKRQLKTVTQVAIF